MAKVELIGEYLQAELGVTSPDTFQASKFPDMTRAVFREAVEGIEELKELARIKSATKLPPGQEEAFWRRQRLLEAKVTGGKKLLEALQLGYEPHPIPTTHYTGALSRGDGFAYNWDRGTGLSLVFNAPMPLPVIEKYHRAKATGLFEGFAVISPDIDAFEQTPSLRVDPLLLGIIKTEPELRIENPTAFIDSRRRIKKGVNLSGGIPMRVAYWDLGKDRQFIPQK